MAAPDTCGQNGHSIQAEIENGALHVSLRGQQRRTRIEDRMKFSGSLLAAIVQAAPIPLSVRDGLSQVEQHVRQLADTKVGLVVFGEAFLGGYPLWFDHAPNAAIWQHPGAPALHRILLGQALTRADPRLQGVQDLVDRTGILVSFGTHERVRNSLLNAQFLLRPRQPPMIHRKLVPTHGERMIWSRGDGSTLGTHLSPWGPIGGLICWEHWMPLARAAMHHEGEAIHLGAWPSVGEAHMLASRHYAFEGRCYVLAAGTIQHRSDLLDGLDRVGGDGAARDLILGMPDVRLQFGGSAVIGPDGKVLAQAGDGPETLITPLDLSAIGEQLATLDTDGHFARPDVFRLVVDRHERTGIEDCRIDP